MQIACQGKTKLESKMPHKHPPIPGMFPFFQLKNGLFFIFHISLDHG
jgi:hypothetical protein